MKIQHTEGKFYLGETSHPDALLEYEIVDEGVVRAYHTVTDPKLQGQGIAGKLYDAFMDFVRENDLKVKADCSYVLKKMKQDPEEEKRLV